MFDRDYFLANDHHRQLIAISQQDHILREAKPAHPGIKDRVLLQLGGSMIALGQRLRSASINNYDQSADLKQEPV